MWAADIGHSRGSRHLPPAGADYTLEGRNALHSTPASALLQQICASATITTTAHSATHHPSTPTSHDHTYSRPHHEYLHHLSPFTRYTERASKSDARRHDAPTSRPTTSLRSPSIRLAPTSGLTGASQNLYLAPAPLHFSSEVPEPCDNLGHSYSRKCSRPHKSR
jgi:hypothetical protein